MLHLVFWFLVDIVYQLGFAKETNLIILYKGFTNQALMAAWGVWVEEYKKSHTGESEVKVKGLAFTSESGEARICTGSLKVLETNFQGSGEEQN